MAYKILTKNGIENTNIDGAREFNFNAGRRSGIVKGILQECLLTNIANNITIGLGELRIAGHRVVITEPEILQVLTTPATLTKYSIIARITVASSVPSFQIMARTYPAQLVKDNLDSNLTGDGTHEIELGTYEVTTSGTIQNLQRTPNLLQINTEIEDERIVTTDTEQDITGQKTFKMGNTWIRFSSKDGEPTIEASRDGSDFVALKFPNKDGTLGLKDEFLNYITNLYIPASENPISTKFQNHPNFEKVVVGDGITRIENEAFKGCVNINDITLPDSLQNIGARFTSSTYVGALTDTAYYKDQTNWTDNNNTLYINNVLIRAKLYSYVGKPFVVREGTTCIGACALISIGANKLTLPDSLRAIGDSAFYYAQWNETEIPDSVTYLGDSVFSGSSGTRKVIMGSGITSVPSGTFRYCPNLQVVDFRKATSVPTLVNKNAFDGANANYIVVVKDDLYDVWINADNWKLVNTHIVKASEYTEV